MQEDPSNLLGKSVGGARGDAPRRTRKPQLRSAETQARVLDAAIECLVDVGYARTSTTIVAERAGVSRGAMLHHFPVRRVLVAAAVERLLAGFRTKFDQVFATPNDGPDRLDAAVRLFWSIYKEPTFAAAWELYGAARTDPDLLVSVLPVFQQHKDKVVAIAVEHFPGIASHPTGMPMLQLTIDAMYGMALERHLVGELPDEAQRLELLIQLASRFQSEVKE